MTTEFQNRTVLLVEPIGKPRVLRGEKSKTADKWRKYKRDVQWLAQQNKLELPEGFIHLVFYLPPPSSWSQAKREKSMGLPVKVKPDWDNLAKGFFDALFDNDSQFWDVRTTKLYGLPPRIEIFY